MNIAKTPSPPYYAVIFTSIKTETDEGYHRMSEYMMELAQNQEGFLGVESAREEIGITISYWKDLKAIHNWKQHTAHQNAQEKGKNVWYESFTIRIAKVEAIREFNK